MARIPIISFFTGGGLLDLGLEQAGFTVVWTNENDCAIADLYEEAMTGWRQSQGRRPYITEVSSRDCITQLSARSVLRRAFPFGRPEIFGVVGGPPCPDFSNGGTHAGHRGKNGKLTKTFVNLICELRPTFFVLENVAGLFVFRKHRTFLESQIRRLRNHGYLVDAGLLNALELGVPQDRERLFVVGLQKRLAQKLITRRFSGDESGWFSWPEIPEYVGAKRLPWPTISRFGAKPKRPKGLPMELSVFPSLLGNGDPELLPNGLDCLGSYSPKFNTRDEGDVSAKSFKRLHRYRYSPTAWYGNREVHLHPWKPRRLSVREALRLQSVPDDYVLQEGTLSAKFRLVCNGVPCRMAELLGRELDTFLRHGIGN